MLATQELRKQHSCHSQLFTVNARRLAEFLQSVETKEALLVQRACDREVREALEGVGSRRQGAPSGTDDGAGETMPRAGSRCDTRVQEVREEYGEF